MLIFFYITTGLLLIYAGLITFYLHWWKKIPSVNLEEAIGSHPALPVTVIIPARNEEKNIGACLQSLLKQTYPAGLLQIIVVNDHSTDTTKEVVLGFGAENILLINLADYVDDPINSYKKKAIEVAISKATGELIITTDADCTVQPNWVRIITNFHLQNKAAFIAAPVRIETNGSLLSIFQSLDFLTLQGITGASVFKRFHSMCNGANLAYEKKVFYEVGGFKGIDRIASGDDMLLMHKIFMKYPERVFFLKSPEAIVTTLPALTWKAFFHQRIRWASKADKYDDKRIFLVLLLVYVMNISILIILLAGFIQPVWFIYGLLLVAGKFACEEPFVRNVADFFQLNRLLIYFPLMQPLHIIYTVIAGFLGKFGTYEWKGRKVN